MSQGLKSWHKEDSSNKIENSNGWYINYKEKGQTIDLTMGSSAFILGYGNEEITNSISEALVTLGRCQPHFGQTSDLMEECSEHICTSGNWDYYVWAQSGTDAVEAAIAISDAYWKNKKDKILTFTPAWHGTSYLTKSMGVYKSYRNVHVPTAVWDNALEQSTEEKRCFENVEEALKLNQDIGCIVIDPMPWFMGLNPWSKDFLIKIRNFCDSNNILMIGDDVGSCWGKGTTTWHSFPSEAQPDITAVGKAISGGYAPLSAALTKEHVQKEIDDSFGYAHTFSPYVGGLAAYKATKDIIVRDDMFSKIPYIRKNIMEIGSRLQEKGLVKSYKQTSGVVARYEASDFIDMSNAFKYGLSAKHHKRKTIGICAPLTANDTYFHEIETNITNMLTANKKN